MSVTSQGSNILFSYRVFLIGIKASYFLFNEWGWVGGNQYVERKATEQRWFYKKKTFLCFIVENIVEKTILKRHGEGWAWPLAISTVYLLPLFHTG